ncbi:MAG: putative RNase H-like nuclease (RuvC/YqgF family) [Polaribacter sp.]|jgi:predicted RNase H-like nuclease (RuvC/YqgF family)
MLLLDIFCAGCTPYLLMMLAGAWGLGWVFWKLLKENGLLSNIKNLETEVTEVKKENVDLKTELTQANYEVEKKGKDLTKARHRIGDFELQGKVAQEKFAELQGTFEQLKTDYEVLKKG